MMFALSVLPVPPPSESDYLITQGSDRCFGQVAEIRCAVVDVVYSSQRLSIHNMVSCRDPFRDSDEKAVRLKSGSKLLAGRPNNTTMPSAPCIHSLPTLYGRYRNPGAYIHGRV